MQDLTDSGLLTQGAVSRLVARIETAGLVVKVPFTSDRRMVYFELTPKGRKEPLPCMPRDPGALPVSRKQSLSRRCCARAFEASSGPGVARLSGARTR